MICYSKSHKFIPFSTAKDSKRYWSKLIFSKTLDVAVVTTKKLDEFK